jgi:hypothetical protein
MILVGLGLGVAQDVWGWWPFPVVLVSLALWLVWRDQEFAHRVAAKRSLIGIGVALVLVGLGALSFVIWFSGFEF